MLEVLAIIPARSGSKGIKNKNIKEINGKPMLAYSIEHALNSEKITRVIVSTDSEEYAEIARKYGAETPFLRPSEFSTDTALDLDVFRHALEYLKEHETYTPDIVVQLRPTYPIRNIEDIDKMVEIIENDDSIDSVRCITKAIEIPYKMWTKNEDGLLSPIVSEIAECYNMPRQELPQAYYQNACIDVIKSKVIIEQNSMSGAKIVGYEMSENYDIDSFEEFSKVEQYMKVKSGGMIFVFDIDGVIMHIQEDLDYNLSKPNKDMVNIINELYDMGNKIILLTARGYKTGIDWLEVTEKQLKEAGLKYHELKFGKPNADFYIDDKMLGLNDLYNIFNKRTFL